MRLPLDLSNGGWHMPKSLNFRHVNRYSEDRTSQVTRALEMRTLQAQVFQVLFLLEAICIALPGTKKEPLNRFLLTRLDVALSTGHR